MTRSVYVVLVLIISVGLSALFTACGGGGGGGSAAPAVTYKYKITAALSFVPYVRASATSQFTIQWNEDASGNITGIFTDEDGTVVPVTGISNGSGRTITGTLPDPIGPATKVRLLISQTGPLNGTLNNVTLEMLDTANTIISTDTITVVAETSGEDEDDEEEAPGMTIWDIHGKFSCWSNSVDTLESGSPGLIAINKLGDVYTWGQNTDRSLGHSGSGVISVPQKLTLPMGASAAIYVSVGNGKGAIIDSNNKLYEFGYGRNLTETVRPMGLVPAQIEFSKSNAYILDVDGNVWVRGSNEDLQLGQGNSSTSATSSDFTVISGLSGIKQILAHPQDNTIYALTSGGAIYGWGDGTGQRFTFGDNTDKSAPFRIFSALSGKFLQLSRDFNSFMAVHENKIAYTWGNESSRAKLGRSGTLAQHPDAAENFVKASPGQGSTPAVAQMTVFNSGIGRMTYMVGENKKVYKWGKNQFGDGLGNLPASPTSDLGTDAVEVTGFPNVIAIKNCNERVFVVKPDGIIWGAGSQYLGGLGNGQDVNSTPVGAFTSIGLDMKD